MLNFEALGIFRQRVQKPDCWNKYRNPINNLLYAVLLQATLDSGGYYDGYKQNDGKDARQFLTEYGKQYADYLRTKERFGE